jgi:hypothetical protein
MQKHRPVKCFLHDIPALFKVLDLYLLSHNKTDA